MIYEPSYMNPYLGDVDGSIANTFSCIVNADGGSKIVGYKIVISDLSGNNIYTPSTQILTTPLYSGQQLNVVIPSNSGMVNGSDYVWNISLYGEYNNIWVTSGNVVSSTSTTSFVLPPSMLIKEGMYININNQARQILSYNSVTGETTTNEFSTKPVTGDYFAIYSNYITSVDSFFKARTTPTLSIDTIPNPITSKNYTFTGTYSQAQNVQYKYFKWTMYDVENNIVGDSGEITTGTISYTFDGFINNNTYGIQLSLETQDGQQLQTNIQYFGVIYKSITIETNPVGVALCDKTGNRISWENPNILIGQKTGTGEFLNNTPFAGSYSYQLNDNSFIEWDLSNYETWNYNSTLLMNWTTDSTVSSPITVFKAEQTPIYLLTLSSSAPSSCRVGDYYYNTTDKLIYKAIENNLWGVSGQTPIENYMYINLQTDLHYIWNSTNRDLEITNYDIPQYTVSYYDGVFTYTITNGNTNITNNIVVSEADNIWLLQPYGTSTYNNFIWDDTAVWNDSNYLYLKSRDFMNTHWAKITLLPTEVQVVINAR